MAAERERQQATAPWRWLPDDTEESVVGTQWHQEAISRLKEMLLLLRDRTGAPWDTAANLGIRGFLRRDGSVYTPMPDVCVYERRLPRDVAEISLAEYGPPALVVEVASPSTWEGDVGEKAATYARGGVPAYLIFDVSGALLAQPVLAWHLRPEGGGTLVPWAPEADGRWHTDLGVAL